MDRIDADRLWAEVRALLRAPAPADDPELRRAARLLAASRGDAVELLLARGLAARRDGAATVSSQVPPGPAAEGARPAPARSGPGLREATLLTAGLAGGALLAGLLDDDADGGLL